MNAVEFACFFERLQKSVGYGLDTDIVGSIFDHYEGCYENYTLLELISMLSAKNVKIECAFNKKTIIEFIKEKKIDIPKQYEPIKPTSWNFEESSHYHYIFIHDMYFGFYVGDIFKTQAGVVWILDNVESYEVPIMGKYQSLDEEPEGGYDNMIYMYFTNQDTGDDICIQADDFIYHLDHDDMTILFSNNMRLKNIMHEYLECV